MRNGKSYSEAGLLGAIKTAKLKAEQKQQRIEHYNLNPSTCNKCNKSISYEKRRNKFCSKSCSASYSNLGKTKNPNGLNGQSWLVKPIKTVRDKKIVLCCFCQSPIKKNATKYCSLKCQADHRWVKLVEEIQKNNGFLPADSYGRANTIKKYLIRTLGKKCQICGIEKWNNKEVPLVTDHIDGDSTNNSLPNLRVICCNCDAQTPTYKGKNRGKGRAYRRKRYVEGKSY
jgi:hypothetical protein